MTARIIVGDCMEQLRLLPADSVHCVVTSPPYWGLRDYGVAGQLGLERTPEEYVAKIVSVFSEVRRVLRGDGTLWLNLGDCYATGGGRVGEHPGGGQQGARWRGDVDRLRDEKRGYRGDHDADPKRKGSNRAQRGDGNAGVSFGPMTQPNRMPIPGLKTKDLVGIPWRVAFALQADGWYLRSDIVWSKPNPMPESVTDRPTKSHEYVFLLTKSERYYYDHEAIKEPQSPHDRQRRLREQKEGLDRTYSLARDSLTNQPKAGAGGAARSLRARHALALLGTRNKRTVWTVSTRAFKGAHFATFPPELIEPCILAGTSARTCELCGAPWCAVYSAPVLVDSPGSGNKIRKYRQDRGGPASSTKRQAHGVPWSPSRRSVIDWSPSCRCTLATGVGVAVVLDPFAGAGTSGFVSEKFGRDSILIELNPDYAEIIRRRIEKQSESPVKIRAVSGATATFGGEKQHG